jgi:hypothetical protein
MNIFQSFRLWWIAKTSIPPSWLGQESHEKAHECVNNPATLTTDVSIEVIADDVHHHTDTKIRSDWDSMAYMAWIEGGA